MDSRAPLWGDENKSSHNIFLMLCSFPGFSQGLEIWYRSNSNVRDVSFFLLLPLYFIPFVRQEAQRDFCVLYANSKVSNVSVCSEYDPAFYFIVWMLIVRGVMIVNTEDRIWLEECDSDAFEQRKHPHALCVAESETNCCYAPNSILARFIQQSPWHHENPNPKCSSLAERRKFGLWATLAIR